MKKDEEIKDRLNEQLKVEQEAIQLSRLSLKRARNLVSKFLIHTIFLDSMKHLYSLQSALKLVQGSQVSEEESEEFKLLLKRHVALEDRVLEVLEEALDKVQDQRVKFLLQNLASDEKRHHHILTRLLQLLSKEEPLGDERWWDFFYRYARISR